MELLSSKESKVSMSKLGQKIKSKTSKIQISENSKILKFARKSSPGKLLERSLRTLGMIKQK